MANNSRKHEDAEIRAKLLEGISIGMPYEYAAARAGVSKETFYRWAKSDDPRDEEFMIEVFGANAEMIFKALTCISKGEQGWQANAWKLERRFPKKFGRGVDRAAMIAVEGEDDGDDEDDIDVSSVEKMQAYVRKRANG